MSKQDSTLYALPSETNRLLSQLRLIKRALRFREDDGWEMMAYVALRELSDRASVSYKSSADAFDWPEYEKPLIDQVEDPSARETRLYFLSELVPKTVIVVEGATMGTDGWPEDAED